MREADPFVVLVIIGLMSVAAFLVGMRFYRRAEELSPKMTASVTQVRHLGLAMIVAAPLMFLFFCLFLSGVLGPAQLYY